MTIVMETTNAVPFRVEYLISAGHGLYRLYGSIGEGHPKLAPGDDIVTNFIDGVCDCPGMPGWYYVCTRSGTLYHVSPHEGNPRSVTCVRSSHGETYDPHIWEQLKGMYPMDIKGHTPTVLEEAPMGTAPRHETYPERYFQSQGAYYHYALLHLDGQQRADALGVTELAYHDPTVAFQWLTTISYALQDYHQRTGANLRGAMQKLQSMYEVMIDSRSFEETPSIGTYATAAGLQVPTPPPVINMVLSFPENIRPVVDFSIEFEGGQTGGSGRGITIWGDDVHRLVSIMGQLTRAVNVPVNYYTVSPRTTNDPYPHLMELVGDLVRTETYSPRRLEIFDLTAVPSRHLTTMHTALMSFATHYRITVLMVTSEPVLGASLILHA